MGRSAVGRGDPALPAAAGDGAGYGLARRAFLGIELPARPSRFTLIDFGEGEA